MKGIAFSVGDWVEHEDYGQGKVVGIQEQGEGYVVEIQLPGCNLEPSFPYSVVPQGWKVISGLREAGAEARQAFHRLFKISGSNIDTPRYDDNGIYYLGFYYSSKT